MSNKANNSKTPQGVLSYIRVNQRFMFLIVNNYLIIQKSFKKLILNSVTIFFQCFILKNTIFADKYLLLVEILHKILNKKSFFGRLVKRHFCIGHLSIQTWYKKLCERLIMNCFFIDILLKKVK